MSKIYTSMLQLIGNTPLLKPERYNNATGVAANLLVKLDAFNPAGSAKDRIAKAMIEDAEKKGILKEGSVIIEPTSGNTGIGLAAVAAAKGYRAIFTMPETMSIERRNLISAYGAEIVLTPGKTGMKGAVDKANELAKEIPDSFIPGQFTNPVNPEIHRLTTGPEIYEDTDGAVDIFLAGVGTGGTLTGTGEYLKASASTSKKRNRLSRSSLSNRKIRRSSPKAMPARINSRASAPTSYRKPWTPRFTTKSSRSRQNRLMKRLRNSPNPKASSSVSPAELPSMPLRKSQNVRKTPARPS